MSNIYINKTAGIILAIVMAVQLVAAPVFAESLWSDGSSLFADRKAKFVGDSLTIVISESSSASRSGAASNSKASSTKVDAGVGVFSFLGNASAGSSDGFKAQGAITNSNTVSGKISVQVTGVKPNGNLLIAGTQTIKQNNEEQKITITGEVRPDDVNPDNTVYSYNVANAQLKIDGKGPLASKQKQGILTQIFNFLF